MLVIGGITFGIAVRGQPETLVPNLQGKDVLDALMDLQSKELYPTSRSSTRPTARKDTVLSQRPAPGTLVKAGKHVTLRVSKGPIIDKVENYVGMSLADVKSHLQTVFATHSPNIIIKTPIIYQYKAGSAVRAGPRAEPAAGHEDHRSGLRGAGREPGPGRRVRGHRGRLRRQELPGSHPGADARQDPFALRCEDVARGAARRGHRPEPRQGHAAGHMARWSSSR